MKIDVITKDELNELSEQIRMIHEKIDQLNRPLTKIVKGRQLRQFLGEISESALTSLRAKGIIPFMQIEKTYYYDLDSVLKALKNHEYQAQHSIKPLDGISKPPPPMDLMNLNFRNPLQ